MYGKTEAVFVVYMAVDRLFVESNSFIFLQNSFADSLLGNYLFMSKLSNTMRNHLECLSDDMFLGREHHFFWINASFSSLFLLREENIVHVCGSH